jgi:hypothetical protein
MQTNGETKKKLQYQVYSVEEPHDNNYEEYTFVGV